MVKRWGIFPGHFRNPHETSAFDDFRCLCLLQNKRPGLSGNSAEHVLMIRH